MQKKQELISHAQKFGIFFTEQQPENLSSDCNLDSDCLRMRPKHPTSSHHEFADELEVSN